ncbi:potassium channel family protein [Algihabitans albus]|uniref:potassium channel family protein n=1 Tax=Algihabitans albus TaxID=2164067 RepID=UPI001ABCE81E|nr:ion channel [Algihabitans albus]
MQRSRRGWAAAVGFTVTMILLVTLAVSPGLNTFGLVVIASIAAAVSVFYFAFASGRFFTVAFANYLALYTCVFVFFVQVNFLPNLSLWAIKVGFLLPIIAFMLGALRDRPRIQSIVSAEHLREQRSFWRPFIWLLPVMLIGAATFALPGKGLSTAWHDGLFVGAMTLVALIVLFVSREVAIFLLDTGLLFEDFFRRISRLVVPTFAFLTFYTLLIVIFACLYRIIDVYTLSPHFRIAGELREIAFLESLYFSVITLSTVGYGDIVPTSDPIRVIAAIQIVLGVLLLLFGFTEIRRYTVEQEERERERRR